MNDVLLAKCFYGSVSVFAGPCANVTKPKLITGICIPANALAQLIVEPVQILPSLSECWGATHMPSRLQPMGSWGPFQQNQVLFPANLVRVWGESCRHTSSGLEAASPCQRKIRRHELATLEPTPLLLE